MADVPSLEQAAAAMADGDWSRARSCFEAVLAQRESPEALFGLGNVLWWLGETRAAVRAQERAYAAFRHRSDPLSAALAAMSVCLTYRASLGNYAASRGWVGRMARLVEQHELVPMLGWLALCQAVAANDANDPATAERLARGALETARLKSDSDLELCALSELGYAVVQAGRVADGAVMLDEAMAGALSGEGHQLQTVVFTGCRSIVACSRALEVERAAQWIRAAEPFTHRYGAWHLYTTCRTHYGAILFGQGKWVEAEQELHESLRIGQAAEPALHAEALAKLAELRVAQGRLDEATQLLAGFEDQPASAYPRAWAHLRRGEPELAATILDRQLDKSGEGCLQATPLCELRAEADLAGGQLEAAMARAVRLTQRGDGAGCAVMTARGERVKGHVLIAGEDTGAAVQPLGRALDIFTHLDLPYDAAQTHLLLARAHGDGARAIADARAALEVFEGLGAARDADEAAALLRGLGVPAPRGDHRRGALLSAREQEVLALIEQGLTNHQIAERLFLSPKTVEHHVRSLFTKLGVANRAEAAAYAVRHRLERSATK